MAELGYEVLGLDVDAEKIEPLSRRAGSRSTSRSSSRCCRRTSTPGRLRFTTSYAEVGRRSATCTSSASARRSARASTPPTCATSTRVVDVAGAAPDRPCARRRQVHRAGRHRRPARSSARRAGPGRRAASSWPGTRSSCARASRSRTRCARTGSSSAVVASAPRQLLREVYAAADRRGHAGPGRPTSPPPSWSRSSANAFLATKISFINAMAEVCEATGADVDAAGRRARPRRRGSAASSSTPGSASAAAACPRTSAPSWPGPASSASTRR